MDENTDIAFLAASCEREMRANLGGSSIKYNKTDFRRFLGNAPPTTHINPQHFPQSYPNYNTPQQNYSVPVDPYIPNGIIPPSEAKLLPVPNSNQFIQHENISPNIESTNSFQIPDYNSPKKVNYLEDEETFRNALIEEIKSLKNNIKSLKTLFNKLNKAVEQCILQSKPEINQNADTDKS